MFSFWEHPLIVIILLWHKTNSNPTVKCSKTVGVRVLGSLTGALYLALILSLWTVVSPCSTQYFLLLLIIFNICYLVLFLSKVDYFNINSTILFKFRKSLFRMIFTKKLRNNIAYFKFLFDIVYLNNWQ